MQTTVPTDVEVRPGLGTSGGSNLGGSGGPNPTPPTEPDWPPGFTREDRIEPSKYKIMMWLLITSVTMLFVALTSAYIFRQANRASWKPLVIPVALWVSTGFILLSSVSFELARRALRKNLFEPFRTWVLTTTVLGVAFLIGQVLAWRQLTSQGLYLQSNPHSSFFYLLTGLHGLHLLGGIIALAYVTIAALRMRISARNRNTIEVTSLYWHFMDGLWVYLFALLFFF
jgi:cytochrome c oxidase subunit III